MVPSPTGGRDIPGSEALLPPYAFPLPLPGVASWPGRSPELSVSPSVRLREARGWQKAEGPVSGPAASE